MWSVFQRLLNISTQLDMEHGCVQHHKQVKLHDISKAIFNDDI